MNCPSCRPGERRGYNLRLTAEERELLGLLARLRGVGQISELLRLLAEEESIRIAAAAAAKQ